MSETLELIPEAASLGNLDAMTQVLQSLERQLSPLLTEAAALTVTSCDQVSLMKRAGELRKAMKSPRCEIENCRKKYGAFYLQKKREIDEFAKAMTERIEPLENRMKEMETFAERAEAAQKEATRKERESVLHALGFDYNFIDIANMPNEGFAKLWDNAKQAKAQREEDARKAEESRLAAIKAEADRLAQEKEAQRQLAAENERLRKEAEERERKAASERQAAEEDRRAESLRVQAQLDAERKAAEAARRAEQQHAQAQLDVERKAREEAEAKAREVAAQAEAARRKLQAEKEATEKAIKVKAAADEKARKAAAAAPDIEKVKAYIKTLMAVATPAVSDLNCNAIIEDCIADLNHYMERAEKL